MMNSASLPILISLVIIFGIFFKLLKSVAEIPNTSMMLNDESKAYLVLKVFMQLSFGRS